MNWITRYIDWLLTGPEARAFWASRQGRAAQWHIAVVVTAAIITAFLLTVKGVI